MKHVRLISRILYSACLALSIVIGAIGIYAAIVILIGSFSGTALFRASGDGFQIMYPFSKSIFLLGDFSRGYITMMLIALLGYSFFIGQFAHVCRIFSKDELFTAYGVRKLSFFYRINFLGPLVVLLLGAILGTGVEELCMIALLHGIIGIFAYFMAAIFHQGLTLQREQDLTI